MFHIRRISASTGLVHFKKGVVFKNMAFELLIWKLLFRLSYMIFYLLNEYLDINDNVGAVFADLSVDDFYTIVLGLIDGTIEEKDVRLLILQSTEIAWAILHFFSNFIII